MDANRSQGRADREEPSAGPLDRDAAPAPGAPTPGTVTAPRLPGLGGLPARLGESFRANPVTGSAGLTIPLPCSAGRAGAPELAVSYDSSARDGRFGYGWDLPLPAISRRTDRGIPRYRDESDVFTLSGAEDLVPADAEPLTRTVAGTEYEIRRYMPRIEGAFTRIERWTSTADPADCKWRTITGDDTTTWFGEDASSRVADPADPRRIFSWLISSGHDDKGNAVAYEYAAENGDGVDTGRACEARRTDADRSAARHLKRVRYGNTAPHYPVLDPAEPAAPPTDWLFTLVLDYGDHDLAAPAPEPSRPWPARPDPYSDRRAGFEVRTYRRCERALMFHDLPELGDGPTLVRSVDFAYDTEPVSGASRLASAASTGYRRTEGGYERRSAPPLTPRYQAAEIDPTVRDAADLPAGLDPAESIWVDLDGEGVSGILSRQRGAWYYTRNRSPLHDESGAVDFAEPQAVTPSPVHGGSLLLDLTGDGRPDLVSLSGPAPGFAGRDETGAWRGAQPFASIPTVDFAGAAPIAADLTGDGLPDLVLTDPGGTRWCEGLGTEGFAAALPIGEPDELRGPAFVGASATEAVQLADMTGDGLPDLVRIGNGTVAYRPALGHGRFGPTVTMDGAPRFDRDAFDPRRLLLADIDGNGRSDLVYLAADGVRLHANRGGDAWGEARLLPGVPGSDNRRHVSVVDLRGTGTACLVWSTSLPGGTGAAVRYVDLMSAGRPHLLTGYENGTGGDVRVEYRPSTHFMLADERAGRPWPTALPFPVSCAHRVVRVDRVRETAFTSRTSYHDGYFDPVEREFRGFGRVETVDTEAYGLLPEAADTGDADLYQSPVLTRTWYHTGAAAQTGERLLHTRRSQYFANDALPEHELPEPELPAGTTDEEYREACRALKGLALRSEVYGLDGTEEAAVPYSVSEAAYAIRMIQPRGERRHGVFQPVPAESIGYGYDRRPADPRVAHAFVLETDDRGRPLRSASVAYRRAADDPSLPAAVRDAQARTHASYTETDYTADIEHGDARRDGMPFEVRAFELAGLPDGYLSASQVDAAVAAAERVPFEAVEPDGTLAAPTGPVLRLTGRSQTVFRSDDLAGPLPLGEHGLLGLAHRGHRMVFTEGLIAAHYDGSVTEAELADAGYEHRDGGWWAASDTDLFGADAADHFYLPAGAVDPAGVTTTVERDVHDLAVVAVTNHIGQQVRFEHDYRLLAPWATVDAAGNRAEIAFDVLGAPVASALVGKPGDPGMDSLADPTATATATVEYDLFAWRDSGRPVWTKVRHRERHGPDDPAWQETYAYFDGSGAAAMSKGRAAPGPARRLDEATGTVVEVHADPRWIGSGRTVFNNKGLPVKQYEPYFSTTHEFESEAELVQVGVTAIPRYDPLGRAFRVDYPDGTFARTDTDPWKAVAHGPDDTVLDSAWYAERGSPDPAGPEPADPDERAAWLAAQHAGTPSTAHLDSLGRTALTVADNGGGDLRFGRGEADATGAFTRVFDTRGRRIAAGVANMAGGALSGDSAERGRRWALVDVVGRMVRIWDEHGRSFRVEYDELHRPIAAVGAEAGGPERVLSRVVFGDALPDAAERNLIGKPHMVFDTSGAAVVERCDSKGNALSGSRRFTADHTADPDWAPLLGTDDPAELLALAAPFLEAETEAAGFAASFDALGRVVSSVLPDGTEIEPVYDEANHLAELRARIGGAGPMRAFMTGQEYDALGRRVRVGYGNGTTSTGAYDPQSRRLTELLTVADASPGSPLQHLSYTYDAAGKIVEIGDGAQQTHFFAGAVAAPRQRFRYDALGQLVRAQGREHAGIAAGTPTGPGGPVGAPLPHPNDTAAVRPYTEEFEYDDLGNLMLLRHMANGGGWNRRYRYAHDADPADPRNRLTETSVPSDDESGPYSHQYHYDVHGNMISTPNLAALRWDVADRLREVNLGGGGTAHYGYASAGRARKVIERGGGLRTERRYLGAVEVYREWMNGTLRLERRTVHLADEGGRFAQADTKTVDPGGIDDAPLGEPVVRYQYGNHLGSAALEADESGAVISYEEYHPYGSTAYRSERPGTDLSLKRYRFHGKEKDDETGLYYYGARYYAPWLGRWISADPIGLKAGPNLYAYCSNDPIGRADPTGTEDKFLPVHPRTDAERELLHPNPQQQSDIGFRRRVRSFFQGQGYDVSTLPVWNGRLWRFPEAASESGDSGEAPPGGGEGAGGDDAAAAEEAGGGDDTSVPRPNPARAAHTTIARAHLPRTPEGDELPGSTNFWSTEKGEQRAAEAEGHRMRQTRHQAEVESDVAAARRANGGSLDWDTQERPYWAEGSRRVARDTGLSQRGARSWGLGGNPRANTTIQRQTEIPTVRRYGGGMAGLAAFSGVLTLWGASQIEHEGVRDFGYAAGATEIGGAVLYGSGLAALGHYRFSASLMRLGTGLGRYAGGAGAVVMSGYALINDFNTGNYGVLIGDAAGIVAGGAVLVGSGAVAGVAGGVALANSAGDIVESLVTPHAGRTVGVLAGTASGALVGAGVGAAVGVWFFGVGAGVGAAVGGVIGGVVGFIGAYW